MSAATSGSSTSSGKARQRQCQRQLSSDVIDTLPLSRRGQRHAGSFPIFFVVLLVVATTSFFHSFQDLPHSTGITNKSNAMHTSLQNFKLQPNRQDEEDPAWIDQLQEDPLPNPPLSNGTQTFSACLLVMVSFIVAGISLEHQHFLHDSNQ